MIKSSQDTAPAHSVGGYEIDSSRAAVLLHLDIETNFLAFVQSTQAGPLHGADMNEHVLLPGIRRNETVTLGGVEPLDRTPAAIGMALPYWGTGQDGARPLSPNLA